MKKLLGLTAILLGLALLSGCANNLPLTRGVTRSIVGTGVAVGVQKAPTARLYLEASKPVVCSLASGTNVSPEVIVAALEASPAAALKTPEATIIINGALSIYTGAFENYSGSVKNAPTLQAVLQGTCDGIGDGLAVGPLKRTMKAHVK